MSLLVSCKVPENTSMAQFNHPTGVAVDSSGNVYVADTDNHRIRKITPERVVTTLAGSGTAGFANATGTQAQFNHPLGVAVDSSGNVYVADTDNDRIRKITPAGVVSTLAGSTEGFADGTANTAKFDYPGDVAVDSSGNVYVADTYNDRIRKITPADRIEDRVVSTLAGTGTRDHANGAANTAKFDHPFDVAIDSSGNVYVADTYNHRIRKITPADRIEDRVVSTLAGTGDADFADATGNAAKFNQPTSVAVDSSGNVYVADRKNNRIRKITPAGMVSTLAGSTAGFADGTGTAARFNYPTGVAVDSAGNVYVADYASNRIRKITPAGVVSTFAGGT